VSPLSLVVYSEVHGEAGKQGGEFVTLAQWLSRCKYLRQSDDLELARPKISSSINAAFYFIIRSLPGRSLALMNGLLHFFLGDNPERTRFVPEIIKSRKELNDIHRFPGFEVARVSRNRLLFVVHAYTV
jgi:hypothetical protein